MSNNFPRVSIICLSVPYFLNSETTLSIHFPGFSLFYNEIISWPADFFHCSFPSGLQTSSNHSVFLGHPKLGLITRRSRWECGAGAPGGTAEDAAGLRGSGDGPGTGRRVLLARRLDLDLGGCEIYDWLVVWNMFYFPICWE